MGRCMMVCRRVQTGVWNRSVQGAKILWRTTALPLAARVLVQIFSRRPGRIRSEVLLLLVLLLVMLLLLMGQAEQSIVLRRDAHQSIVL